MKLVIAFALALVVAISAAPPGSNDAAAQIVRSAFDQQPEGAYVFNFETDNGISRSETGEVKVVNNEENKPQSVVVVRGSYAYPDETGKQLTINYFADETGYHAEGDGIPVPKRR